MKSKVLNPDGSELALRLRTYRNEPGFGSDYAHCDIAFCLPHDPNDANLTPRSLPFMHALSCWGIRTQMGSLLEGADPKREEFYATEVKWGQHGGFDYYELTRTAKAAKALQNRINTTNAKLGHPVGFAECLLRVVLACEIKRVYHYDRPNRTWICSHGPDAIRNAFDRQERIARSLLYPETCPL